MISGEPSASETPDGTAEDHSPARPPSYASVIAEVEPAHLDRPFDYAVPPDRSVSPGQRVEVAFGGRRVRGLVVAVGSSTDVDPGRVRPIRRVLGEHIWVREDEVALLVWAGQRYAAPVAAAVRHALPGRVVDVERRAAEAGWYPCAERPPDPRRPDPDVDAWDRYGRAGEHLLDVLDAGGDGSLYWRPLPAEDLGARLVELTGLTLAAGRDVLLVVPEPVSQAADAVLAAYPELAVDARGLGKRATYRAWLEARTGRARVVVGERGVAFWPLDRLGLGMVVDESNPALKERRTPRHHAREVVLERCRRAGALGLLIGTVPSAAAWRLLAQRRLSALTPVLGAERSAAPLVQVDDRNDPRSRGRIGPMATDALRRALADGRYGIVLAARRGEGRALACSECGLRAACPVCASSLASRGGGRIDPFCEGCGWQPGPEPTFECDRCGARRFAPLAAGAQRLGEELARTFPEARVATLEGYAQTPADAPALVVMTRGSATFDPPGPVGAVVLLDIDGQVRRPTLDASEDALRLSMRLASWVAHPPGERGRGASRPPDRGVVVQTREPDHPVVQALVRWDPGGFWRAEVPRRSELRFPPAAYAVRIDAADPAEAARVADDLRQRLPSSDTVLGPRSENGGRGGLLLKVDDRAAAVAQIRGLQPAWSRDGLDVRVDVDPVDVA